MGPTIENNNKFISFLGVKGGVGCSILSSILGRIASEKNGKKIALIDATPFPYSLTPSYLSISAPNHYLMQLHPYQDHLTAKMIENYFSLSPEGLTYIPLKKSDETLTPFSLIFPLVDKLAQWFDHVIFDLSSFPSDQYLFFIEKFSKVFFISSLESTSLTFRCRNLCLKPEARLPP